MTKTVIDFISDKEKWGEKNLIKDFEIKWNELKDMESSKEELSMLIVDFLNKWRESYEKGKCKKNMPNYIICIHNFEFVLKLEDKFFLKGHFINPFSEEGIIFFIDSKDNSDPDFYYNSDRNVLIDKYHQ